MKKIIEHETNGESRWFLLLSKEGGPSSQVKSFVIKQLSEKDADEMSNLSQEVYTHLRNDEKTFIHQ